MSPAERRDYLRDIVANDLGVNPDFVLTSQSPSADRHPLSAGSGHQAALGSSPPSEVQPPPTTPDPAVAPEPAAGRASLPITTS